METLDLSGLSQDHAFEVRELVARWRQELGPVPVRLARRNVPAKEQGRTPFTDVHAAWRFLEDHPIFEIDESSVFFRCLHIEVIKVNPVTGREEKDETKNTATHVLLECGPYVLPEELTEAERQHFPYGVTSTDHKLTCLAPTFEEALVMLANRVQEKYG
jgi:hypothetical protein